MSRKYIVVFKKSASREAIDEQAKQITSNGGKVGETIDSTFMKSFSAEIPEAYLMALQSNLTRGDSEIDYIEPDSVVTTQLA